MNQSTTGVASAGCCNCNTMPSKLRTDDVSSITNLPDAINVIKFLKISHKAELAKWMEACKKQAQIIKQLESSRHQELAYLSNQLHKYEFDLLARENSIAEEIAAKNKKIDELNKVIESLQHELINISRDNIFSKVSTCESSDSGIVIDKTEDSISISATETSPKKRQSSFSKSINFFRKVDFSPKKNKKVLQVTPTKQCSSFRKASKLWRPLQKTTSDDDLSSSEDSATGAAILSHRPHKMDDSMTNHYCEQPSESEREQIFDRVMTRSSVRKSVKKNPKYQRINRTKSKHLDGLRHACEYSDST